MIGVMGFGSLLIIIGMPLAVVFLLVWTYKIKRNSDIQIVVLTGARVDDPVALLAAFLIRLTGG
ncbi:hypothetical protein BACCIP111895_04689 [Neobacillus rhizosphaerae]|uniref:Uncharacterized protein n=1 Tax=Neobacillus rhizosphaerae TaxID=2880965 RepID=A0ABM9EXN9_9BACI|nr:hypothetical protein [Neobacillus rhizosphaerae]CAH2717475.1 hypothetical protein BACCIP111895_04689 [Neobacillus rhizosphaerae]